MGELPPSSLLRSPRAHPRQGQLSPGMGSQRGVLQNSHGRSDLSEDISAGGNHLPAPASSRPCFWSPLPCSIVTKPPLLAGQSVPSNAGLCPRGSPVPISA